MDNDSNGICWAVRTKYIRLMIKRAIRRGAGRSIPRDDLRRSGVPQLPKTLGRLEGLRDGQGREEGVPVAVRGLAAGAGVDGNGDGDGEGGDNKECGYKVGGGEVVCWRQLCGVVLIPNVS